jgi:hypothetical protein
LLLARFAGCGRALGPLRAARVTRYLDGFGFSFRPGHVEFDRIESLRSID